VTEPLAALVDTNILFDVLYEDPAWAEWSLNQLLSLSLKGALAINDVIYAELSVRFASMEDLDRMLASQDLHVAPTPRAALFMAAKAFERYRTRGGPRTTVLPDFFIGAHAAVLGAPLLTRDARRYRTAYPRLRLVTP
jgi:predicted nucleic acid-binding protein